LLVGWLWFLATLVPVIGLVQVGGQAMADRYTYIPIIGIFLALTFEACSWIALEPRTEGRSKGQQSPKSEARNPKKARGPKSELARVGQVSEFGFRPSFGLRGFGPRISRSVPFWAATLLLIACIGLTERQLRYWSDSRSLLAHAVAVTRNNALAHVDLGVALEEAGKQDEALQEYQTAVRLDPHLAQAHNNLANLLMNTRKLTEALDEYNEAMRLKPTAALVHENVGTVLVKLNRFDEALRQYEEAIRLDSRDARPQYLIGKALLRQGRSAEAVLHFREALRLDPNHLQSMVYLARVLAADENPTVRNGPEAVSLAERANALVGTEQPFLLDTLAMAHAEAGRFDEARQAGQRALDRAKANGEGEAASALQQRLNLYLSQHAYREALTNAQPETIVR
jgi:tetratricopeptide (TPR) repeat protein